MGAGGRVRVGRGRPNYTLRRLLALTIVVVVAYSFWRLGAVVVDALGSSVKHPPSPSGGATGPGPSPSPGFALAPACAYGNRPAERALPDDWASTLVDTEFRLPSTYVPPHLVSVAKAGFVGKSTLRIRALVIANLGALREAAAAAGHPIDLVAAYRSYVQQASLFERRKAHLGLRAARRKTAQPGHSEHQLGTAVDLKTFGQPDVDAGWDSTPTGRWIFENAYRFGFVQSYPQGKTGVTCYAHEPWHYRYLGRDVAEAVHASGLTLREFLWNQQHGSSG